MRRTKFIKKEVAQHTETGMYIVWIWDLYEKKYVYNGIVDTDPQLAIVKFRSRGHEKDLIFKEELAMLEKI